MNLTKTILQISFLSLFFFIGNINGQTNELSNLPKIGQKVDKWCWAASMEMVINYHKKRANIDTLNQCEVGIQYYQLLKSVRPDAIAYYNARINEINSDCIDKCSIGNIASAQGFNRPLSLFRDNFENILAKFDFTSIEDASLITWEEYEKEIDNLRPVILNYTVDDLDAGGLTYLHSVVAKGHFSHYSGTYFLINDPLDVCIGKRYLLNKAVYDSEQVVSGNPSIGYPIPNSLEIESINSMVHHIKPNVPEKSFFSGKIGSQILPPDPNLPTEEDGGHEALISAVTQAENQLLLTDERGFFSLNSLEETLSERHSFAEIQFLSYPYLRNKNDSFNFKESLIDKNFKEVIYYGSTPPLKNTIRCSDNGDTCIIERIEFEETLLPKQVEVNGQLFKLDNRIASDENISYTIIKYYPYSMEFYSFNFQGQDYLAPKDNFSKALFNVKDDKICLAIPTLEILTELAQYTKEERWELDEIDILPASSTTLDRRCNWLMIAILFIVILLFLFWIYSSISKKEK